MLELLSAWPLIWLLEWWWEKADQWNCLDLTYVSISFQTGDWRLKTLFLRENESVTGISKSSSKWRGVCFMGKPCYSLRCYRSCSFCIKLCVHSPVGTLNASKTCIVSPEETMSVSIFPQEELIPSPFLDFLLNSTFLSFFDFIVFKEIYYKFTQCIHMLMYFFSS